MKLNYFLPNQKQFSLLAMVCLFIAQTTRALDVNVPAGGDIQTAINQVASAGGGNVNLTNGTWTLTTSLAMKSNVSLNGMGANTILQGPLIVYNYPLIGDGGVEPLVNLTVQNLVIDGRLPSGGRTTDINANSPYGNVLAILFAAYTYNHQNILINNVEARNVGMGIHVKGTMGLVVTNCYLHDNGISYWGSHNMYLRRDVNVLVTHVLSEYAHAGVGLHIVDGSNWLITKSSFIGNNGLGVNAQDNPPNFASQDCYVAYNNGTGIEFSGNDNTSITRNRAEYNAGDGIGAGTGAGTNNWVTNNFSYGNSGATYNIHGAYTTANNFSSKTPNLYEAELAIGASGLPDTADWVTTNAVYNLVGSVDFNANHLTNGLLTWPNVSVASTATYPVRFRYSNGTSSTQVMQLTVNGAVVAPSFSFPPTASWATWAFVTNSTALNAGNNNVQISAVGSGAPDLDYLQVITSTPALPGTPTGLAATTISYRQINLKWNASSGAGSYNVRRATTSGGPYMVIAGGVTVTNFNDANLLFGGQTNYYVVSAVNAAGENANSLQAFAVTTVAAPGGFSASASVGQVALQWLASYGAKGYNVKRATLSGGAYTTIASLANTADITSSNNIYMNFSDTAIAGSTNYFYVVTGTNALGESQNSYEMSVATLGPVSVYTNSIGYWQTMANWTNKPIAPGNDLVFTALASVSTNDFPNGIAFASLTFANFNSTVWGTSAPNLYTFGSINSSSTAALNNFTAMFANNAVIATTAGTLTFGATITNPPGNSITMQTTGGSISFPSAIMNNGTINVINSTVMTFSAPLSGTGSVVKSASSQYLDLAAANTFTGILTINGGVSTESVRVDNSGGLNTFSSIRLNDNSSLFNGSASRTIYIHNVSANMPSLIISDDSVNTIIQSSAGSPVYSGTWTGGGVLQFLNGFSPNYNLAADMTSFSGTLVCGTGSDTFNLQNTGAIGLPQATVWLWNGQAANSTATTALQWNPSTTTSAVIPIGALWSTNSNSGTTNILSNAKSGTTATYQIGGLNADSTFSGIIQNGSGTTALSKVGEGALTLTAANTFSGGTTVSGGILRLNNVAGSGTGSGIVTVANGGTLAGNGIISGAVTNQSGGTLAPGDSLGTLTVNNTVTLQAGSTTCFEIDRTNAPNSDKLIANTINGGGTLTVANTGSTDFVAGDTFTLFSSAVSGFSTVNLPSLPLGKFWINRITVDGTLVIGAVNIVPTNIIFAVTGNQLQLNWPSDHTGWTLQTQTNSLCSGLGTNWVTVAGSSTTNRIYIPIGTTNGSVFFRLVSP